ncbi:hypothetical protein AVEN_272226-1 [Araneus ventricosus]|uniref:Transposable element P transposase-like RNase H domain-containing protein n=1 Tax=Araneus ventricosus TaxID=182803 RepID=A0A4Y2HTI4_ARAVE|nr:hypothetical protein AVEN_10398-1 [Araneus ventricosus]GBM68762.1 hypothetical protein AVEN_78218-1 [Araneus ventricosus]GBM68792.1 hypothetical protein AVEN_215261-1 [Araneus ventricosus]GBM69064.1 hypothetical protein AVEN_272226-1 [Araneus ventricosus]
MLSPHEKLICLLIDEIYVNPGLNYKGGKLLGKAENANQQANTIQAFMITSLFSKYKEIVALVPMKNQTADDLYCQALKVLQMLNDCKYNVLCLISDNNRINRNMFTQMCQGNLVNCISNPVQPENKLFFLFDTVHLIKSVRNNWFNEKTLGQVLCFPSPDNSSKISLAKLQDLKDIYETEKSNLIKNAPKLSRKVLYPTSFEKQNVLLALNIFHESNSAALAHESGEKGKVTIGIKEFIDQFLKWWNIVNVKNSEKGKRLKNPFCDPIWSKDQMSMVFLNKFYDWLASWNNKSSILPLEKRKELGLPGKGITAISNWREECAMVATTVCRCGGSPASRPTSSTGVLIHLLMVPQPMDNTTMHIQATADLLAPACNIPTALQRRSSSKRFLLLVLSALSISDPA